MKNADAVFYPATEVANIVNLPARYLGDPDREVTWIYAYVERGSEIEPGLYPDRKGQECHVISDKGNVPYPLVLEFLDGERGIARRECVAVGVTRAEAE